MSTSWRLHDGGLTLAEGTVTRFDRMMRIASEARAPVFGDTGPSRPTANRVLARNGTTPICSSSMKNLPHGHDPECKGNVGIIGRGRCQYMDQAEGRVLHKETGSLAGISLSECTAEQTR